MKTVIRGDCPDDLSDTNPSNKVRDERAAARATFQNTPVGSVSTRKQPKQKLKSGKEKAFEFSAHTVAQAALRVMFLDKCAYCEDRFGSNVDPEVEHFRPKAAVEVNGASGKPTDCAPGYYWLATRWENLTLSCPVCNKKQRRAVHDGAVSLCGKGCRFPLEDEAKRAKGPGDELYESPLLLEPSMSDVERYFTFEEDGRVYPSKILNERERQRAEKTIEVFGLNRATLCEERAVYIFRARYQLNVLCRSLESGMDASSAAADEVEFLKFLAPCAPFRTAVRQVLRSDLEKLSGVAIPNAWLDLPCQWHRSGCPCHPKSD
jgi:uncharacterized protein (TIGR02646 family)